MTASERLRFRFLVERHTRAPDPTDLAALHAEAMRRVERAEAKQASQAAQKRRRPTAHQTGA